MTKKHWFLLTTIIIIATFLRLYQITTIPPGLYPDEAINGNNALEALRTGHFAVFYPENNGREGLFINIQALFLRFFGVNDPWVLRLPSAVFGILTVLGIYFLAAELFSQEIGLLSAFLLATSFWHINFSRIGFRAIAAPFFLTWAVYFLVKGFRRLEEGLKFSRATLWHAVGGIVFGLGFYTYIAYRVTPALVLIVFVYYWLKSKQGGWQKSFLHSAAHFVFFSIIVALPLAWYFYTTPGSFFGRTTRVSVFASSTPLKDLTLNILKTAGMFNIRGDYNWRHNIPGRPELFWPIGILFLLGTIFGIRALMKNVKIKLPNDPFDFTQGHPEQGRTDDNAKFKNNPQRTDTKILHFDFSILILFAWLLLAALPVVISNEGLPHALRSILILPPVIILAAFGAMTLYKFLKKHVRASLLRPSIIIVFLLLIFEAYVTYFIIWAGNLNTAGAFSTNYVVMGRVLNGLPKEIPKYVIIRASGVLVRDTPMPAQTVMFITDTFSPENQREKNIHYALPDEENKILPGAVKFYLR